MIGSSELVFLEKSRILIQNEIRALNSPLIFKNEKVWLFKVTTILNDTIQNLNEKILDNDIITKETIAEYFFQELELKSKIQSEMIKELRRPLYEIEEQLIYRIIQTLEYNLITLWIAE